MKRMDKNNISKKRDEEGDGGRKKQTHINWQINKIMRTVKIQN